MIFPCIYVYIVSGATTFIIILNLNYSPRDTRDEQMRRARTKTKPPSSPCISAALATPAPTPHTRTPHPAPARSYMPCTVPKSAVLAFYAGCALVAAVSESGGAWQRGAGGLLVVTCVVHLLEFVAVFLVLKLVHKARPADHFLPTLLYGFLHWQPLLGKRIE